MIDRGWYDREFVRDWTNAPFLVRSDTGRLLRGADLRGDGGDGWVAWDEANGRPLTIPAARLDDTGTGALPALFGTYRVETRDGAVECRPAFELVAEACRAYPPGRVEEICGVPAERVEAAARLLWDSRPVAYYAWSGVEMQTGSTQIARAIGQLYALTGSLDSPGGNVLFGAVPSARADGRELLPAAQRGRALGFGERPMGPARWGHVTSEELYRAILERTPYPVRGLVGFGANLLLAHADGARGRDALAALDFYVHADLFMNPTAELADIVLPVASPFEREALKIGFDVSADAHRFVQLRQRVVEPPGEARSDTEIVFALATRLGLGDRFWDGDIDAANAYRLGPSGLSVDELRANPGGVRVAVETRYRKFAEQENGVVRGFATPSRRIELFSETLLDHGYPPVPVFEEPLVSPRSRPDLASRYPLILTSSKHALYCESQHRALPSLRRRAMDPEVEIHPEAAAKRGIRAGDWVRIETPQGSIRARAVLNEGLKPDVICGQHGWWQSSPEAGAPGYDPFGPDGVNLNLVIGNGAIDPTSGSVPHRAYLAEVRPADQPTT